MGGDEEAVPLSPRPRPDVSPSGPLQVSSVADPINWEKDNITEPIQHSKTTPRARRRVTTVEYLVNTRGSFLLLSFVSEIYQCNQLMHFKRKTKYSEQKVLT